ncbi:hypothetical protein KV557_01965 [Kitasatospora aureofaciens]|uniref:hypothetical protein n=1 Tax=Kitasatospora aureofaciens TaxID=1894 RepID=UPI001C455271|nr:hypothetical protein [Kitasatospora aureofaciens]MBV6695891.1 hypothetical protein [Kitasatospora aureofaciens]
MYEALGETFRTRHPDLAGRLQVSHSPGPHLSVPLTGGRSVVLAQMRFDKPYDHTPVWAVVGPRISEPPRIWYGTTDTDVLVDALHARAVAELEGGGERSPWRWDEPAAGEIVALADDLAARGVDVLMAVAQNRCRAVEAERGTKAEYFGRDRGDFLVVQGLGCSITVSHKPLSGWSADVRAGGGGSWQRLDLGNLLLDEPSSVPGVESGLVDRAKLAGLVADLARLPRVPTVDDRSTGRDTLPAQWSQADARPEGSVLVEGVAHELARMGFTDVVPDSVGGRLESGSIRIEWWSRSKSMGLGDLQRLYGGAAVEGRRLMVLSQSSATRPALAFADQAKAFVFLVSPAGRLHASNDLAREAVLDKSRWSPARGLADRWLG